MTTPSSMIDRPGALAQREINRTQWWSQWMLFNALNHVNFQNYVGTLT